MKRVFDCVAAAVGLVVLSPLMALIALAVRLDSPGPALYRHRRVGRGFHPISVYKFRTMIAGADRAGSITFGGDTDARITRVGRLLRETKLDELPQLLNVLRGDMSLVGPRPEVSQYVDLYRKDYETLLSVRPGISDFASIAYRDEGKALARAENPMDEYAYRILPAKIRLSKEYVRRASLLVDLQVIARTVLQVLRTAGSRRPA